MTITAVGSTVTNNGSGASLATSVSPTALGDILLVYANGGDSAFPGVTLTGGGVTTWHYGPTTNPAAGPQIVMCWGVITATGAHTLTMAQNPSSGSNLGIGIQQFHSTVSGTWGIDAFSANNAQATGSGVYPPLVPIGTDTLYVGMAGSGGVAGVGGSTAGYVYNTKLGTTGPLRSMAWVWFLDATEPTTYQPGWTNTSNTSFVSFVLNPNVSPPATSQQVLL